MSIPHKSLEFQQEVIRKRIISPEQLQDALKAQTGLRELGIEKDISEVMVEKGFISKITVSKIRNSIGWDMVPAIKGFDIKKRLGKGGMGAVFLAVRKSDGLLCALKLLNSEFTENDSYIKRFLKEADFCITLNHPNLVKGYETGLSGDHYYFAMEYLDGISYDRYLKKKRVISSEEALEILIGVGRALSHAQQIKLVHRDIKPANIMITKNQIVKLCDLGLSKASDSDMDLTRTGTVVGTPYYIAPEQASGSRQLNIQSDMYSLGATVYHLVAGRPPHTAKDITTLFLKHQGAKIPALSKSAPDVDPRVEMVIHKLLSKKPEKRFTPEELVEECLKIKEVPRPVPVPGEIQEIDPENDYEESASENPMDSKNIAEAKALGGVIEEEESHIAPPSDSQSLSKIQKKRNVLFKGLIFFFILGIFLIGLALYSNSKPTNPPNNTQSNSLAQFAPKLAEQEQTLLKWISQKEWEKSLQLISQLQKEIVGKTEAPIVALQKRLEEIKLQAAYEWITRQQFSDSQLSYIPEKLPVWTFYFENVENTSSWRSRSNSQNKIRIENGHFLIQDGYLALQQLRDVNPLHLKFTFQVTTKTYLFRVKIRDWEIYFEPKIIRLLLHSKEVEQIEIEEFTNGKGYQFQIKDDETFSCYFGQNRLFEKEADKTVSDPSISWMVKEGQIALDQVQISGKLLDSYLQENLEQIK